MAHSLGMREIAQLAATARGEALRQVTLAEATAQFGALPRRWP